MSERLDLRVVRPVLRSSNAEVASIATWAKAMAAAVTASGMKDKSLAIEVDLDPAQFSKTVSGQLGIMPDKLFRFMDACGTEVPLMWLCYQRGYDIEAMRQRETELQRKVRELTEQLAEERKRNDHVAEFFAKARAA